MGDAPEMKLDKLIELLTDISDKLDHVTTDLGAILHEVESLETSVDIYLPRLHEELVDIHNELAQ